ncbi:recombinase family protein [Aeromicrobium camelliae]|uniref:Recombinase family protein n=1 Tax=Aeromicrobium camelliae TaxID=1538144 RepID=A0A3N6YX86_9ACTN|nr:recombinase family protein [Aeromicrobium camelliae]RQN02341.1 recombinase family protein [Aeromicrobium camelliae]
MSTAIYVRSARPTPTILARQEAECQAFADRAGLTVTRCYTDTGTERDDFQHMLEDASRGNITTLLVTRPDRLSRSFATYLESIDALREADVAVFSAQGGADHHQSSIHAQATLGMATYEEFVTDEASD